MSTCKCATLSHQPILFGVSICDWHPEVLWGIFSHPSLSWAFWCVSSFRMCLSLFLGLLRFPEPGHVNAEGWSYPPHCSWPLAGDELLGLSRLTNSNCYFSSKIFSPPPLPPLTPASYGIISDIKSCEPQFRLQPRQQAWGQTWEEPTDACPWKVWTNWAGRKLGLGFVLLRLVLLGLTQCQIRTLEEPSHSTLSLVCRLSLLK